jgi:hypothetical protein
MNRRDYLKKKAVKNNSLWYHNAYKALRNKINKDVICAKMNLTLLKCTLITWSLKG